MKPRIIAPLFALAAAAGMAAVASAATTIKPAQEPETTLSAAALEPLLPPVAPAWKKQGWRAVAPHAFVLRKLAPVRSRPSARAAVAFYLGGGTRVPVLEQGRNWWRVAWTNGRTGWLQAADLEPHASWVFIDVKTGRVTRRLAAKGQFGPVSDGKDLWSLANTGLNRTRLTDPPAVWAYPVRKDQFARLPAESVWPRTGSRFLLSNPDDEQRYFAAADWRSGAVVRKEPPVEGALRWADQRGRMLFAQSGEDPAALLYDSRAARVVRRVPGELVLTSRSGTVYVRREERLGRFGKGLTSGKFVPIEGENPVFCLSTDEKILAVSTMSNDRYQVTLRRADTLEKIRTVSAGENPFYAKAVVRSRKGWTLLGSGETEGDSRIVRFNTKGRKTGEWEFFGSWTTSADGKTFYAQRDETILAVDTRSGRMRKLPFRWRRTLPAQYLPKPSSSDFPTHLDVTALTLTPDGRTLIVTEYLNGDPGG